VESYVQLVFLPNEFGGLGRLGVWGFHLEVQGSLLPMAARPQAIKY
jgi:hypothetical protein